MNDEQTVEPLSPNPEPLTPSPDRSEEYLTGWKRALADYDNLKKDLSRERTEARRYARESAAEAFLPVLEHFDAAVKFSPQLEGSAKSWLSGVLHIQRELEEAMKSLGLEAFGAVGEQFDPALHEAAGSRQQAAGKEGEILEVVRRGWKMGEKVVRPASVIITSV